MFPQPAFWPACALVVIFAVPFARAEPPPCAPLEENPVKIEAWLSKRYEKELEGIGKEFAAMGSTRVILWVYPADNPSRVVAIGRCVPAYIARHALRKAVKFSGGVVSLVHQGFIAPHWIGIATSLFSELSQKRITEAQLKQLMDESLDTREFQTLYRRWTAQDEEISAFGQRVANPKLLKEE